MDTSNPILPQDRRSIAEMREVQRLRRRQDLGYLQEITRAATRYHLQVGSPPLDQTEVKAIFAEFERTRPKEVSRLKEEPIPDDVLEAVFERMPVCGLIGQDGLPLHPPAVNNSKGSVCVRRMMGGLPRVPDGLNHVIEILGEKVLDVKHVYTSGTWKGFVTRIRKQMGRKTVPVRESYKRVLGSEPSMKKLFRDLDAMFPRRQSDWPSLESDLEAHLDRLKVTASSSAGAPYWRNKGEVLDTVILDGLPIVIKAIKDDKIGLLYENNPEMFLCEVKNKMDRYKVDELGEKTRPYCCIPAHWALLFSVLTQKYQSTLEVFDTCGHGVNAYGFSSAGGGLERMVEWMYTADKRGKFVVYGDDTCLVVRVGDEIYRVDPDFQQMDGSLDNYDISLVCQYVLHCLEKEEGDGYNPFFWQEVTRLWEMHAADPLMIIDGTKIYKKLRPHGMMSGVPGTTLFDTMKSALSWNLYLDHCQMTGKPVLDEAHATQFMRDVCGLVIKPGTWQPERLPVNLSPGLLVTSHKFLGVQILVEEYEGENVFVPTIPLEEAIEMLVVQKDNPFEKSISRLGRARRLYDRCRGLYLTFGFGIPEVAEALHNVVNHIDPVAVVMCTQVLGGEKPDSILLEDFAYPDSSGFPTRNFCLGLYSKRGPEMEEWQQIFPTLTPILEALRKESREVEHKVKKMAEIGTQVCFNVEVVPPVERETSREFDVLQKKNPPCRSLSLGDFHPRSHIEQEGVPKPYLPNLAMCIRAVLKYAGVLKISQLHHELGASVSAIRAAIKDAGLFCTDLKDGEVSLQPIVTAAATEQSHLYQEAVSNKVIGENTKFRHAMEAAVKRGDVMDVRPTELFVDPEFFSYVESLPEYATISEAVQGLPHEIVTQTPAKSMRWHTVGVHVGEVNPVEYAMQVQVSDLWVVVASCRGLNKKVCQTFIVQAVCDQCGKRVQGDRFSTQPPPEEGDWAEEVEYENTAYRDPVIESKSRSVDDVAEDYLVGLGGDAQAIVNAIDTYYQLKQSGPVAQALKIASAMLTGTLVIEDTSSHDERCEVGESKVEPVQTPKFEHPYVAHYVRQVFPDPPAPEPKVSKWGKRNRGTPEKRRKDNARTKERKKRKKERERGHPNI